MIYSGTKENELIRCTWLPHVFTEQTKFKLFAPHVNGKYFYADILKQKRRIDRSFVSVAGPHLHDNSDNAFRQWLGTISDKPLLELILHKDHDAIWRHQDPMS